VIFFDIDGTLIDHLSASAAASLAFFDQFHGAIPFNRERFPAIWEEILMKHFNRFCRGEISLWEQRRARIREVFAVPEMSDEECDARYGVFVRQYEGLTCAYDDAAPCLEALAGERLGIISNGARDQQIGKLQRAGLLQHFSVMVFSEDVGFGKPHHSIFLEACRRAGDDPGECVHIGDDIEADVAASHAMGMRPVWLDRLRLGKCEVPARTINGLHELGQALTTERTEVHRGTPQRNDREEVNDGAKETDCCQLEDVQNSGADEAILQRFPSADCRT
jgi:putative hydrolase of the HAD superfamily